MTHTDAKSEALMFLKTNNLGVLSTISPAGTPRARSLYYVCGDDFSIYFVTLVGTRKVEDMQRHPAVAFTVSNDTMPQTVQIEGVVKDVSNVPVADRIVQDIFAQLMSNPTYHAPLSRFDAAHVKFFRIEPRWVRWGDFTSGNHTNEVLFEIPVTN